MYRQWGTAGNITTYAFTQTDHVTAELLFLEYRAEVEQVHRFKKIRKML
jgi:hypothetical protein